MKFPRIVGIQHLVEMLCLNLEPATSSGVFVTGPRESGKTTLIEALIRSRAQGRLSSQLGTKPFYIFDVTGFFTSCGREDYVKQFIQALRVVANSNGLLIVASRDEVFTVLGKELGPDGQLEPVRFDIDFNAFFFFYQDSMRPDLAASKLDSQSPYGVKVTVEATGLYNRLPRFIRIMALKWWDLRPEIVKIVSVDELKALPDGFKDTSR